MSDGSAALHLGHDLGGPREGRVDMLDAVRLLAAFQMIQGHTIDALLSDALRDGAFFHAWTWVRGLTAPIFLIAAGLSFSLAASLADAPKFFARRSGRARTRRMLRSLALIVTGTLMHVGDDPLRIDVLQCVGVSLLILDFIVGAATSPRVVFVSAAALTLAFALLTGWMSTLHGDGWMRLLLAWVGHETNSLFPLFPWAAYVFVGVAIAPWLLPEGGGTLGERIALRGLIAAGIGCACSCATPWLVEESALEYSSQPSVLLLRASCVIAIMGITGFVFSRVAFPSRVRWLAGETLALYVFHLLFLFAAVVGPVRVIGRTLSWPMALLAALVMLALSVLVARAWMRFWPLVEARVFPPERSSAVR